MPLSVRKYIITFSLLIASLLISGDTLAQVVYGQPLNGGGRIYFTHWTLEDSTGKEEIDQLAIPVSGMIPIRDNFEARFYIANVSNDLNQSDNEYSVSGFGDLRIQATHSFLEDQVVLSAGINVPSGKTKLSLTEEWPIMETLSQNFLRFPVRRLGEGPGFNLLLGGAKAVGDYRLGATLMYHLYGKYKAYENGGDYNPGDMFGITANIDRRFENGAVGISAIYSIYGTDKLNDQKIFEQADQLDLRLNGIVKMGSVDLNGTIQFLTRGSNTRFDSLEAIFDQLKFYGNEFNLYTGATIPVMAKLDLMPLLEMKFIGKNDYDFGKSNLLGFGADAAYNLSEGLNAMIGYRFFTGKADDDAIDLSGYQLTAGVAAAF